MLAILFAAGLGSLHFTATGPSACQAAAREGLLLLHSFVYDDAREAFQKAERAAPCPIAFWGEAMSYDHPLWRDEDLKAGRDALARLPTQPKVSPLEQGLIEAARALYGEGDWHKRHDAWLERLQKLHEQLPNDDEATLFTALALVANADGDVKKEMQAVALAQEVFTRNPDHPGAAHYLIHAADSPAHAILALAAARRYAQIAPAASHALHMPSHVFVQLGMWREVEQSNIAAVAASEQWVARKKLPWSRADLHSFAWLAEARLELGKRELVAPMLAKLREEMARDRSAHLKMAYAEIASAWLAATEEWSKAEALLAVAPDEPLALEARLRAVAEQGDEGQVRELSSKLPSRGDERIRLLIAARQAQARSVRDSGLLNEATDAMRALADFEDKSAPSGPAFATPAREEVGDLLMRAHRYLEASREFRAALYSRPNRLHALRGLQESLLGSGELGAAHEMQAQIARQVQ
jgi:hypothetical protein